MKKFKTEKVKGVSYSKKTNTLTLNGYTDQEMRLIANEMGDDFTIKVTGTNSVQSITVYGFHYGGSLTLTGTGSLIINKNKLSEDVIVLEAETCKAKFSCGKNVKLNAITEKSSQFAVRVMETQVASGAINFAGKSALNKKVKKSAERQNEESWLFTDENGLMIQGTVCKKGSDFYLFSKGIGIDENGVVYNNYRVFRLKKKNGTYSVVKEMDSVAGDDIPSAYAPVMKKAGTFDYSIKGTVKNY